MSRAEHGKASGAQKSTHRTTGTVAESKGKVLKERKVSTIGRNTKRVK